MNLPKRHEMVAVFAIFMILLIMSSCSHSRRENVMAQRESWIDNPPQEEGYLYFVGISDERVAAENLARQQAVDDARQQAVVFYGGMVKTKLQKASMSYGLASEVSNPTIAVKRFEDALAVHLVKHMEAKKYHTEKFPSGSATEYKVYALCRVAEARAQDSLREEADKNLKEAEKAAREAADQQARRQAEEAIKFWKELKGDPFFQ